MQYTAATRTQDFVIPPDSLSLLEQLAKQFPHRTPDVSELVNETRRVELAKEIGKVELIHGLLTLAKKGRS